MSSFLYNGFTEATLANSEKLFNSMSWYITLVKSESTIFEGVLIGTPSGPVAF